MNRAEHLQWCKDKAIEYVDNDDLQGAFASMASDVSKHEETANHPAINMGFIMTMNGQLNNKDDMRKFILGFN